MNESYTIRDMEKEDVDEVFRLGRWNKEFSVLEDGDECFWPRETLEKWVESEEDVALVVAGNEGVIGFVLAAYHPVSRKATFENAFVVPERRGERWAKRLYEKAEEKLYERGANTICSFVEVNHRSSLNFIERSGFSRGKAYYWMHK